MNMNSVRKEHPSLPTKPRTNRCLIDGKWVEGDGWTTRESPAHGVAISKTANGTEAMVNDAVDAAGRAFHETDWPRMYAGERATLLAKVANLVRDRAEELALLDVLESGKPIGQARSEIAGAADLWDYAGSLARTLTGESHNQLGPDTLAMVVREPIGVVSIITPWNFPFLIISQKLPYALAAGCTAVVKPSEFTPSSTVVLMEILQEAGVPDGVVNLVTGYGDPVGMAMTAHPNVDMASFTGSTAVGKATVAASASNLKKVSAELGGKNPAVVFADADLDDAADALVLGTVFNAGQCCVGSSRLIVQRDIAEAFAAKVAGLMQHLRIGDPLDEETQIGPVINSAQHERINRYIERGKQSARLHGAPTAAPDGTLFVTPHVFEGVTPEMDLAQDEIFGPVLSVIPFDTVEDAIRIANTTAYGLSSSVWTGSVDTAIRMGRGIEAGTVWINTYLEGPAEVPFGGFKQSGLGRENGRAAIEEYTELKTIMFRSGKRKDYYVSV